MTTQGYTISRQEPHHISVNTYPDTFATFEPGCIVLWQEQRCTFVAFVGFAAVVQIGGQDDCTVVWADQIEFVSEPTADSRA